MLATGLRDGVDLWSTEAEGGPRQHTGIRIQKQTRQKPNNENTWGCWDVILLMRLELSDQNWVLASTMEEHHPFWSVWN